MNYNLHKVASFEGGFIRISVLIVSGWKVPDTAFEYAGLQIVITNNIQSTTGTRSAYLIMSKYAPCSIISLHLCCRKEPFFYYLLILSLSLLLRRYQKIHEIKLRFWYSVPFGCTL